MLLAIDVGNTGMGVGIFEGEKLRITWRMATSISRMPDEYAALLLPLLHQEGSENLGYYRCLHLLGSPADDRNPQDLI